GGLTDRRGPRVGGRVGTGACVNLLGLEGPGLLGSIVRGHAQPLFLIQVRKVGIAYGARLAPSPSTDQEIRQSPPGPTGPCRQGVDDPRHSNPRCVYRPASPRRYPRSDAATPYPPNSHPDGV